MSGRIGTNGSGSTNTGRSPNSFTLAATCSNGTKTFRLFAERYRYPKSAYAAKFAITAGIINLAAGF